MRARSFPSLHGTSRLPTRQLSAWHSGLPHRRCRLLCQHAPQPGHASSNGSNNGSQGHAQHTHDQDHDHDHDHGHHHGHSHSHGHDHGHFTETPLSRALERLGVLDLAEGMAHSTTCTVCGIACYVTCLLLSIPAIAQLAPVVASTLHTACLAGTFVLLGIPQIVESVCVAAGGVIDTHVLMSLAAFGTLYLGMAQEGALLLLLFQLSHILEEKFTDQAQGSLEKLFENLPDQAVVVDMDDSGAPMLPSARTRPAREVTLGDVVLVKPGEEAPLDGVVVWGSASVSQQHISGESLPVRVAPGMEVAAGSRNLDGLLALRVMSGIEDSTPARIARMAAQAQADKPRLSRLLATVGGVWSKAVVGVTLMVLATLLAMGVPLMEPGGALYRAMGVLTAGSPCAVVLVPLAYVCAIATITRRGVLVRSAAALDALLTCTTVALDKTGTITSGALSLTQAHVAALQPDSQPDAGPPTLHRLPLAAGQPSSTASSHQMQQLHLQDKEGLHTQVFGRQALAYAVALSRGSNHPVSRAMVQAGEASTADAEGGDVAVSQFLQVPGLGVQGVCQMSEDSDAAIPSGSSPGPPGEEVMVHFGSLDFIRGVLPQGGSYQEQLDRLVHQQAESSGARAVSSLLVTPVSTSTPAGRGAQPAQTVEGRPLRLALFSFDDEVAPGAAQAVAALRGGRWRRPGDGPKQRQHDKDRKQVIMLTGDNARVAAQVARAVGIDNWQAGLKPEHKLAYVKSYDSQQAGHVGRGLVMVGDGINDAPALAAARVGVAVASTPSDMVAAAADFIILNGQGVANLPWLFAVARKTHKVIRQNLILALTAVVFATIPTVAGWLPLWLAVLVHEGSTLLVALNSLRLLLDPGVHTTPAVLAAAGHAVREMFAQKHGGDAANASPHAHDSHKDHHPHSQNDQHNHANATGNGHSNNGHDQEAEVMRGVTARPFPA